MKRRLLIAAALLAALSAHAAPARPPRAPRPPLPVDGGYHVLALVLHVQPQEVGDAVFTATPYTLVRHAEGPYPYVTASERLNRIGFEGLREGDVFYPVHLLQRAWIFYCAPGCELE